MSIGQRINTLRKQSNLSQEYVAEKLDVTGKPYLNGRRI